MEASDLRWASIPNGLQKKMSIASQDYMWESQKELHDKLRKGGIKLNMGPEGEGLYIMTLGRLGGMPCAFRSVNFSLTIDRRIL